MQPAAGEENRLTKHFCLKISPRNLLTTLTRAASPISCIGPDENEKKGQGRVLWPHILGGAWAFGPGGRGSSGLQGGAWDLLPKVGAGPPWDPPKVTYGPIVQLSRITRVLKNASVLD